MIVRMAVLGVGMTCWVWEWSAGCGNGVVSRLRGNDVMILGMTLWVQE